jgi:hypothetical protein
MTQPRGSIHSSCIVRAASIAVLVAEIGDQTSSASERLLVDVFSNFEAFSTPFWVE